MLILDKIKDDAEKAFLTDGPEGSTGKTLLCKPLDAPYRPGAAHRREEALASEKENMALPTEEINRLEDDLVSEKEEEDIFMTLHEQNRSGSTVNERPKYFDILDAVDHLNNIVFIVQKLCDDIVGVKQPEAPDLNKKAETEPCLLEVLERTPGNIHAGCKMIEDAVMEIRAQIL